MSKHTKGPWVADMLYFTDIPENACVVILAPSKSEFHSGTKVAEASFTLTPNGYHVDNREEAEANARLIAAAPDLLNALAIAREWHRCDKWRDTDNHDAWRAQMDLIESAITKATGADHA